MKLVTRLAIMALPVLLIAGCQLPPEEASKVDSAVESSKMAAAAAERAAAAAERAAAEAKAASDKADRIFRRGLRK
jgi:hypothetical protein